MNFRQFIEAKLGSFVYTLPKDKEEQLYDFYLLSALPVASEQYSGRVDAESLNDARQHAREVLFPALKRSLLDAVFFSITAELRHVFGNSSWGWHDVEKNLDDDLVNIFYDYRSAYDWDESEEVTFRGAKKGEWEKYVRSWEAAKSIGAPESKIVKLAQILFERLGWEPGYGGIMWANICRGWLDLYRAQNLRDMMVYIDRVYQLQHNNDTVFNKIRQYMKEGEHSWLKKALDHKFRADPYELMDKASPAMKRLAGFLLKAGYGTTLQGFQRQREREFEKKFKDKGTRKMDFIVHGKTIHLEVPERELKEFAKKVTGPKPEDAVADMLVKYGDILDNEYKLNEFIKELGIRSRYDIRYSDYTKALTKRAEKFVRKNFQKIHDLIDKEYHNHIKRRKLKNEFNISDLYAAHVHQAYNRAYSYSRRDQDVAITGDKITHKKGVGQIVFNIPDKMAPFIRGKGATVRMYGYQIVEIKKFYDTFGEDETINRIDSKIPSISKTAAKALAQYIIQNYDRLTRWS